MKRDGSFLSMAPYCIVFRFKNIENINLCLHLLPYYKEENTYLTLLFSIDFSMTNLVFEELS